MEAENKHRGTNPRLSHWARDKPTHSILGFLGWMREGWSWGCGMLSTDGVRPRAREISGCFSYLSIN